MYRLRKPVKRRAVSPVIATVVLVAVTITVAVAVAYWMSGIAGQYTQFEKIEIQSGYAIKTYDVATSEHDGWSILVTLKNSGTTTATLVNCFINEKIIGASSTGDLSVVTAVGVVAGTADPAGGIGLAADIGITINSGESVEVTVTKIPLIFSSSGTTVNVKFHSAAGMDYIKLLQLP